MLVGCSSEKPKPPAAANKSTHTAAPQYTGDGARGTRTLIAGARAAAPDGRQRVIWCYNGQLPGPVIRAKLGEKLSIQVRNGLDVPTTVHWHGMHQIGTWRMDGVAGVSQQPIPPGESFDYEFVAQPAGTHWYHAHTGVQYPNGLFGPLIVDEPEPIAQYDREEILLINDWFVEPAEAILAGLLKPAGNMKPSSKPAAGADGAAGAELGDVPFESFLLNGLGRLDAKSTGPLYQLDVKPGETIRLRLINGSSTYAVRFQIDAHRLIVIASDGAAVVPVEIDNLILNAGERYDVLLTGGGKDAAWIRAATLDGREGRGILRYPGAGAAPPESDDEWGGDTLQLSDLHALTPLAPVEDPKSLVKWRLGGTRQPYVWDINGEKFPDAKPIELANGELVRFIIENPTGMDQPFHLHGHYFYVLGDPDDPNLTDPPQKDTVNIPAQRTLALQWVASNPGRWLFECHIEWHAAVGMARVIEIAEK